ncbi:unnamed protein product, partial [Mesorhabditis spiculigera]
MWPLIILALFGNVALADVDECKACTQMAQFVQYNKGGGYDAVLKSATDSLKLYSPEDRQFLTTVLRYNFRKLYLDVNDARAGMSAASTCADMGYCDYANEYPPPFPINKQFGDVWDEHSQIKDTRDKTIIVLHDTEVNTMNGTIQVLKDRGLSVTYAVDINGDIYQFVRDFRRAWQAGSGIWNGDGCNVADTNTRSVGIETVNHGNAPFPPAQINAIHTLIDYLRAKWHVDPQNIIAHHENSPDYKFDISGYFSWKDMYDGFGVLKGVWQTTVSNPNDVVLNATIQNPTLLQQVQTMLFNHGYGTLKIGEAYNNGSVTTAQAVQSFNRKYCPEVFKLEDMRPDGTQIVLPENQQVYALTLARLQWFRDNQAQQTCRNY